jgi:hypothetical protein
MPERRQLGTILLESGRITEGDVQRVLEYQRAHGGFFGQALVALDIVSREEIDWALANQFDLPFIFPNADAVDRAAAQLVPADWALAHLAVPIVRAGNSLTVVVADPLDKQAIDDLRNRTGCDIEMALASAARIRELIHALYEAPRVQHVEHQTPVALNDLIAHALEHGAERFGVSIRGTAAMGWWRTRSENRRAPLADGWETALSEAIHPAPLDKLREVGAGQLDWDAALRRGGTDLPLAARVLVGAGGAELMFQPLSAAGAAHAIADITLPPSLITELRLLWRGGTARVGVGAARIDAARAVLPLLPALSLGEHVRAAHINADGRGDAPYSIRADHGPGFAEVISAFELDAITIDLPAEGYAVRELLRAAPLAFMILDEPAERAAPGEWGINWLLTIVGQPGSYAWDLRALHR